MIKTVKLALKDSIYNNVYRKGICEHCNAELVIPQNDLHLDFFGKPEVADNEYCYKCPVCGHVNVGKNVDLGICNEDGQSNRIFELNENETKAADEFEKEHLEKHKEKFYSKDGKLHFSALGQQFTYTITPGGLGNIVIVKCNECGEIKDISDYNL